MRHVQQHDAVHAKAEQHRRRAGRRRRQRGAGEAEEPEHDQQRQRRRQRADQRRARRCGTIRKSSGRMSASEPTPLTMLSRLTTASASSAMRWPPANATCSGGRGSPAVARDRVRRAPARWRRAGRRARARTSASYGGCVGRAIISRWRPSAVRYPSGEAPICSADCAPPSCARSSSCSPSGSSRTSAAMSAEGRLSSSRVAASAAGMPVGLQARQRLRQPLLVEEQQLAIGQPRPVARSVDLAAVDARQFRRGTQRLDPPLDLVVVVADVVPSARREHDVEVVERAEVLKIGRGTPERRRPWCGSRRRTSGSKVSRGRPDDASATKSAAPARTSTTATMRPRDDAFERRGQNRHEVYCEAEPQNPRVVPWLRLASDRVGFGSRPRPSLRRGVSPLLLLAVQCQTRFMQVLLLRPVPATNGSGSARSFASSRSAWSTSPRRSKPAVTESRIADLRFGRSGRAPPPSLPAGPRRHRRHARARDRQRARPGRASPTRRADDPLIVGGHTAAAFPDPFLSRRRRGRPRRRRARGAADRRTRWRPDEPLTRRARPRAARLRTASVPTTEGELGTLTLDEVPLPSRRLVDRRRREYACLAHRPVWLIETARGCPFRCSFCSIWQLHGRDVRERSIGAVADDFASVGRRHLRRRRSLLVSPGTQPRAGRPN